MKDPLDLDRVQCRHCRGWWWRSSMSQRCPDAPGGTSHEEVW